MRMTDNPVIRHIFKFGLGELQIVSAMLKVLGKYIIDNSLDEIFIETRIYSRTTFGQIIEWKHMKRCLEAYFTLYLPLSTISFEKGLTFDNEKWTELKTDFLMLTNSLQCKIQYKFITIQIQYKNTRLLFLWQCFLVFSWGKH